MRTLRVAALVSFAAALIDGCSCDYGCGLPPVSCSDQTTCAFVTSVGGNAESCGASCPTGTVPSERCRRSEPDAGDTSVPDAR